MKYILYIILSVFSTIVCAQNNKKYALVIGNASYEKSPLRNPLNDADDVSSKFKTLGFEVITAKDCKTRSDMRKVLNDFCKKASNAEAGVFYYSGHGMQLSNDGSNYLVPINAEMTDEADVSEECLSLNHVLNKMDENGINMKVAIIDACRDNPFRTWHRGSSKKGLSTPGAVPSGTFIAFATSANDVAADGKDRNSPFTNAFLSALDSDNLEIDNVFKEVKRIVKEKTNGGQRPWTSNDLSERFYFSLNVGSQELISDFHNDTNSSIIVLDGKHLNGHEYVDLGLSVLWATCNIGAKSSFEIGDWFSWGETETKEYYSYITYFDICLQNNDNEIFKTYYVGGKDRIIAQECNDAAREMWGSIWRMPTSSEFQELCDKCTWKLSKQNGQKGYIVTGPNGKSIFIPFCINRLNREVRIVDSCDKGVYWTSELSSGASFDSKANALLLNGDKSSYKYTEYKVGEEYRYLGATIRPVFDLNTKHKRLSLSKEKDNSYLGHLELDFSPKDANVYINGKLQNFSSQQVVDLPVGNYTLEIKKKGYKDAKEDLYIRNYHTTKFKVSLLELEDIGLFEKVKTLYESENYSSCITLLESLANKGMPDAQYLLGICYSKGNGVTQNHANAVYWFSKAAYQGLPEAQNELGVCYDVGLGVNRDVFNAAKWWHKAALQGNADAQYNLAFVYTKGRGVDKSYVIAYFWYCKAAEQGDEKAKEKLRLQF